MVLDLQIFYHDGVNGGHDDAHDEVHGDDHDVHDVLKLEKVLDQLIFFHDGDGVDHGCDGGDDESDLDLHLASPPQKRKQKPLVVQQPEK